VLGIGAQFGRKGHFCVMDRSYILQLIASGSIVGFQNITISEQVALTYNNVVVWENSEFLCHRETAKGPEGEYGSGRATREKSLQILRITTDVQRETAAT